MSGKDERAARLAAALRDNLRRRKAQTREAPDESAPEEKPGKDTPDPESRAQ